MSFLNSKQIFILIILAVAALFLYKDNIQNTQSSSTPLEVKYIEQKKWSFNELLNYFNDLTSKKGADYSYEILHLAKLPENITVGQVHSISHSIGQILFSKKGANGLQSCNNDFRDACFYEVVIGLYKQNGDSSLPAIAQICGDWSGGEVAYIICYHELGHGILGMKKYDLPETVKFCQSLQGSQYQHSENIECIGGAIMELVEIGETHNPTLWQEHHKDYFREDNVFYPCTADFMPNEARSQCYKQITPHLLEVASNDVKKAFSFCRQILDENDQSLCFAGFGRKALAYSNINVRIDPENITDDQLKKAYQLCLLADNPDGSKACISYAVGSLYIGGVINRSVAQRFCSLMDDNNYKSICIYNLINSVSKNIKDINYKKEFCSELPITHQVDCRNELSVN